MLSRPQPVPHGEVPASPKVVKNCCTAVLNTDAPAGSAPRPRRSTVATRARDYSAKEGSRANPLNARAIIPAHAIVVWSSR